MDGNESDIDIVKLFEKRMDQMMKFDREKVS